MSKGFSGFQVGAFQDDAGVIDNVDIIDEVKEEVLDDVVDEYIDEVEDEYVDEFPDDQPSQPEEPVFEDDYDYEDVWEEPSFENVSISSVLWGGNDEWDRAVYKLSNGRTVFASKGLGVGQSPFDYDELRISGGGYYGDPNGTIVGHTWSNNADALILKRGEGTTATFHQQMYAWGNQGIVISANTQDVTNQIGAIEERSNSDIDGDGTIGDVKAEEAEVEIDSALYDNPDGEPSDIL